MIALYEGQLSEEQTLAAAQHGDTVGRRARDCDVAFFLGELQLLHGQSKTAMPLLRQAIDICPAFSNQRVIAQVELKPH